MGLKNWEDLAIKENNPLKKLIYLTENLNQKPDDAGTLMDRSMIFLRFG